MIDISTEFDWSTDTLSQPIVKKLQDGVLVETREFLKPIFRWTKLGNKQYNVNKAFSFVEWMIYLTGNSDTSLSISQQKHLQPKYAFNTIVTMSQRAGRPDHALKAYKQMLHYKYEPDVFTLTALLDVVGRKGSLEHALEIYDFMMSSERTLPNIVSFVTMIGIAGSQSDNTYGSKVLQRLYSDAQSLVSRGLSDSLRDANRRLETSLFNASLAACVHLSDFSTAKCILTDMITDRDAPLTSLTTEILAKLSIKMSSYTTSTSSSSTSPINSTDNNNNNNNNNISPNITSTSYSSTYSSTTTTTHLLSCGIIGPSQADSIDAFEESIRTGVAVVRSRGVNTGCLGPQASDHLRSSVITHDVNKLIDRLTTRKLYVDNHMNTDRDRVSGSGSGSTDLFPMEGDVFNALHNDDDDNGNADGDVVLGEDGGDIDDHDHDPTSSSSPSASPSSSHVLVENDFTTLLHQCRKRKWIDQISFILQTMRSLATIGIPDYNYNSHNNSTSSSSHAIPPLPHLTPTLISYEAAFEAAFEGYFSAGWGPAAWELYQDILNRGTLAGEVPFLVFLAKGFLQCGEALMAVDVYKRMRLSDMMPTRRLVCGLMAGLGRCVSEAMEVLMDAFTLRRSPNDNANNNESDVDVDVDVEGHLFPFSSVDYDKFVCTLLESCAVLGRPEHVNIIIDKICSDDTNANVPLHLKNTLNRLIQSYHPDYVLSLLMAACCTGAPILAHEMLFEWQSQGLLPPFPWLHVLVTEAFGTLLSSTPQSVQATVTAALVTLPFDGFLRVGAVKYLEYRRPFVRRILRLIRSERSSLYGSSGSSDPNMNMNVKTTSPVISSSVSDGMTGGDSTATTATATAAAVVPGPGVSEKHMETDIDIDGDLDEERCDEDVDDVVYNNNNRVGSNNMSMSMSRTESTCPTSKRYNNNNSIALLQVMSSLSLPSSSSPVFADDDETKISDSDREMKTMTNTNTMIMSMTMTMKGDIEFLSEILPPEMAMKIQVEQEQAQGQNHQNRSRHRVNQSDDSTGNNKSNISNSSGSNSSTGDNYNKGCDDDNGDSMRVLQLSSSLLLHYLFTRLSTLRTKEAKNKLSHHCQLLINYIATATTSVTPLSVTTTNVTSDVNVNVNVNVNVLNTVCDVNVSDNVLISFISECCLNAVRTLSLSARQQAKVLALLFQPIANRINGNNNSRNSGSYHIPVAVPTDDGCTSSSTYHPCPSSHTTAVTATAQVTSVTSTSTPVTMTMSVSVPIEPVSSSSSTSSYYSCPYPSPSMAQRLSSSAARIGVGLDIWRELHRYFFILQTSEGKEQATVAVLKLLSTDREKPIKIVQFVRQHGLCTNQNNSDDSDNSGSGSGSVGVLIDNLLRVVRADRSQWNALAFYLGGGGGNGGGGDNDNDNDKAHTGGGGGTGGVCDSNDGSNSNSVDVILDVIRRLAADVETEDLACKLIFKYSFSHLIEFRALIANTETLLLMAHGNGDENGSTIGNIDNTDSMNVNNVLGVGSSTSEQIVGLTSSSLSYLSLSQFLTLDKVVVVNDMDTLLYSENVLLSSSSLLNENDGSVLIHHHSVVGIDVEWRPFTPSNPHNKCSLLQIACMTHVFIFDLMVLQLWDEMGVEVAKDGVGVGVNSEVEGGNLSDDTVSLCREKQQQQQQRLRDTSQYFSLFLSKLFTCPRILKIGFGLSSDMKRLRESYPDEPHYHSLDPFLDLSQYHPSPNQHHHHPPTSTLISTSASNRSAQKTTPSPRPAVSVSLSALCVDVLGHPLDKRMQRSDWEYRPLLSQQLEYAALDALVLIHVHRKIHGDGISVDDNNVDIDCSDLLADSISILTISEEK
eukprot:gene4642-9210_t